MFRQSDSSSYLDAGISSAEAAKLSLGPGQGLWSGSKANHVSLQVARLGAGGDAEEAETVARLAEGLVGSVAPGLVTGPLPVSTPLAPSVDQRQPVVAVADMTLAPVSIDLTHDNVLIQGEARTGRSTALETVGAQAARGGAEVWAIGMSSSPLTEAPWAFRKAFGDGDTISELLGDLFDTSQKEPDRFRLLAIDDVDLLLEDYPGLAAAFDKVLRSVRWVASAPRMSGYISDSTLQQIKKARTVVYLSPVDIRDAADVLGITPPWHPGLAMPPGRGHIMAQRRATLVHFMSTRSADGRQETRPG